MVLLLNLVVPVVVISLLLLAWKKKNIWFAVAIPLVLFFYMKVQPSYMPKGDIPRTSVPSFKAPPDAVIEDRNRKPVPSEVRQAEQERMYREGPVFLQK